MAEPVSRQETVVQDWPGLATNSGPQGPPGNPGAAREQVNLQCNTPGELTSRPGYRKVRFDSES